MNHPRQFTILLLKVHISTTKRYWLLPSTAKRIVQIFQLFQNVPMGLQENFHKVMFRFIEKSVYEKCFIWILVPRLNLVFLAGKFTIRNKENGLFLSIVDGKLAFTEVKDANSDWFLQDSNEIWGAIVSSIGKVLDVFGCGIDSCPVGLWNSHGGFNQKWRRSGYKIVSALPGYLAQDNSGNLVVISKRSDGNKDWIKLEIGNIMTNISLC